MSEALITVGIPTYNRASYLEAALDSVFFQEGASFEVLVVDNASTDATPELMAERVLRHPRLRYYRNETNLGMAGNWWRTAMETRTPYLKFLMDDDLLKPGCLAAFEAAIREYPSASLLACLADAVDAEGHLLGSARARYAPDGRIPGALMQRFLLAWTNQIGCPTHVVFKQEAILPHVEELWRRSRDNWSPDFAMMIRALSHGDFVALNRSLVAIRHHGRNMGSSLSDEAMQAAEEAVLRDLARLVGGGADELALAERHAARTAFVRGVGAFYDGRWRPAARYLRRWVSSPERARGAEMALAHTRGRVLLPARLLSSLVAAKRVLRPPGSASGGGGELGYRYADMERFWQEELGHA